MGFFIIAQPRNSKVGSNKNLHWRPLHYLYWMHNVRLQFELRSWIWMFGRLMRVMKCVHSNASFTFEGFGLRNDEHSIMALKSANVIHIQLGIQVFRECNEQSNTCDIRWKSKIVIVYVLWLKRRDYHSNNNKKKLNSSEPLNSIAKWQS